MNPNFRRPPGQEGNPEEEREAGQGEVEAGEEAEVVEDPDGDQVSDHNSTNSVYHSPLTSSNNPTSRKDTHLTCMIPDR